MNVLAVLVVSFVLVIGLGSVSGGSCFCPDCHHHHAYQGDYTLDNRTHWHCAETEFCYMHKNRAQVDIFQCVPLNDSRYQECLHKSSRNHHACRHFNNDSDCTYCCKTRDCYLNLMTPSSHHVTSSPTKRVTTTTVKTTMTSSSIMTKTTDWRRHGCFSYSCGHSHFSLRMPHLYTRGHWTCRHDEVCLLHTRDGMGNIRCVPKNSFEPNLCRGLEGGNQASHCHHYWNPTDCSYCCATPACMHTVANALYRQTMTSHATPVTSPTTTTVTSPTTTTTTMTSPTTSTAVISSVTPKVTSGDGRTSRSHGHQPGCFRGSAGNCHPNPLHYWEYCFQGEWTCGYDQFCDVKVYHAGYVHTKCIDNQHRPQTCHVHHSRSSCMMSIPLPTAEPCHFCCSNPTCVRDLLHWPHSTTPTTAVTTTTTPTAAVTTTTTATAAVTTTATAAVTTTTNATAAVTTTSNAAVTATATAAVTTTSNTAVTATATAAVTTTSNAAVTTTATAAVTTTSNAAVTTTPAAAATSSSATSALPMTNTSTTPMTLTTTAHKIGQCVQCGDYNSGVPCSNLELFLDSVSACTDPTADLCMTDISVDVNGDVSIYKRCVSVQTCLDQWYLQTSDKSICQQLDPAVAPPDVTCHYCCVGDGCNTNNLPDPATFWKP